MRVGVKVGGKQDDGNDRETVVVRNDVCVPCRNVPTLTNVT